MATAVLMVWATGAAAAVCWDDGFGGTLALEINLRKLSSKPRAFVGKQCSAPAFQSECLPGVAVHPVSGVTFQQGSKAILGVWTYHEGPGNCATDTYNMVLDLTTNVATGILRSLDGTKLDVTWVPKACP